MSGRQVPGPALAPPPGFGIGSADEDSRPDPHAAVNGRPRRADGTGGRRHEEEKAKPKRENSPLVIGHRGASGFLPEHTRPAYRLAIKLGADYIEPDLVATKDGVLIARHEPLLGDSDPATTGDSTNVGDRPEFASRETTMMVDGVPTTGFFASDFTLAEIKTLGARQTRGGRPTGFNGRFRIPTLQELIDEYCGGMLDGQHIALGVVIERSYDAQPGVTGREVSIRTGEALVLRTAECRGRDRLLELIERIVDRVAPNL